jgi:GTP-binding protein
MEARYQRLPTGILNDLIRQALSAHPPPSKRGKRMKVYYVTQAEVAPPTFVFFINDMNLVHFGYKRYLENRIREAYAFPGTPIRMVFRGHEKYKEAIKNYKKDG